MTRALLLFFILIQGASANPVTTDHLVARLIAEQTAAVPGGRVDLALVFDIADGWHTYWQNPGDSGEPPRIHWHLPQGVTAGPIHWPYPARIPVGPLANYGYSGQAVHLIELRLPSDWPAGRPLAITAEASWLVCAEHCIPESGRLDLTLATAPTATVDPQHGGLFSIARARLPIPLAGAVVGPRGAGLRLAVALPPGAASPSRAEYFPFAWGLIEPGAEQPWHSANGRLTLDLTPGELAASAGTAGVLVVAGADRTAAYTLDPAPDSAQSQPQRPASDHPIGLPLALGFALLGGLILNLMPCVFPVLAMKALALAGQGAQPWRARAGHALAYTAGVLAFFGVLASLLLALRGAGGAVGWGFQLQYPPFVAFMALVFCVLALSLAGALTLGTRLMGAAGVGPRDGITGAFATGGLAALVAAPCTAPFMGAALGYALTLSWPLALTIMLTLGLGLALPFVLLSLIPAVARLLPRPGPWMEHLKQFLAFPMLATAAWLVWVLSVQSGPDGVAAVLAAALLLATGLWIWERVRGGGRGSRLAGGGAAILAAAGALVLSLGIAPVAQGVAGPREGRLTAEPYSPARLAAAREAGRPVLVNMTAAWCITCLVNERVALSGPALATAMASAGAVYLKGDWTNREAAITAYLEGFGRNGVPLYVVYPPTGEPRVLPQILTESLVLAALSGR